jgi:NADH-quinone oxidoreductase subunit I
MANRKPTRRRGLFESLYLPAIFAGLGVTGRHVIRNIARPGRMITIEYPEVRKTMTPRYRGAHRLLLRADGRLRCVACMCCPTACPARCIVIEAGEDPLDPSEKIPVLFQIDMLRCIYCGFCVEACPKDAIRMDTAIYEIVGTNRRDLVNDRDFMVSLFPPSQDGVGPPHPGPALRNARR